MELVELCQYNTEHLSGMHPSLVPDCNNDGVTQSGLNQGKSYTNMCIYRWNGCHKFQRLDIDVRLILSGFREVGASNIPKSWSYESPKQNYFRLKLMINKWGEPSIGPTWRHVGVSGNVTVYYFISEVPHFYWEGARGGALAIFVYWGCAALKGIFSQFLSGKGVVFSPTVWQGSRFLSGKGVVFRPNTLARGVFWSCSDTARSFCK